MINFILIINSIILLIELIKKFNLKIETNTLLAILKNIKVTNIDNECLFLKNTINEEHVNKKEKSEKKDNSVIKSGSIIELIFKYLPDVKISYTFSL
jgi:hypothetical protein